MANAERRTQIPAATKRAVFDDALVPRSSPKKYRCALCNEPFPKSAVQVDHIIGWVDGGTHERSNLRILCSDGRNSCHRRHTRKQAASRARAPKSRAHLTGRIALATLVLGGFLTLAWLATDLSGQQAQTDALLDAYKTTALVLTGLVVLTLVGRKLIIREPTITVDDTPRDRDRIEAWIAKLIPDAKVKVEPSNGKAPTITVDYPSHVGTHDGGWRNEVLEKAEDLYPSARISIDWQTERDRFVIRDTPDPLAKPVESLPMEEIERAADYASVDFGITEDGKRFRLPIIGSHFLTGGQSGSGKSISFWVIMRGLAPGIRDGLVKVHAIDPKGGVELGPGLPLFASYSDGEETKNTVVEALDAKIGTTPMDAHLSVLIGATDQLRTRLKAMKADGIRKVERPSLKYPLHIIVIDEAAFVLAYAADPKAKKAAQNALEVLTSQGRAAGFVVMCLVQDPSAEVTKIRNLLPRRIAMRVDNPTEVRMLLGDGAVAAGARAHKIPRNMPGVGYTLTEEDNQPKRFRTPYISDAEVAMLARDYSPNVTLTK